MIELVKQGINTVITWVKTVWEGLPEDLRPGVTIAAIIGATLLIKRKIFKR